MKIGIYGNIKKHKLKSCIEIFLTSQKSKSIEFNMHTSLEPLFKGSGFRFCTYTELTKNDMNVVFGGDGTILGFARKMTNVRTTVPLIFGINMGKLGFLSEFNINEAVNFRMDEWMERFPVMNRLMLCGKESGDIENSEFYALNDFVISSFDRARVISIAVDVNGEYLTTFNGDGIIISTPTGSTAYSMSAGGPIVCPENHNIIITPICPHSLSNRPILLPADTKITVYAPADNVMQITADGQNKMDIKSAFSVCKSQHFVRFVGHPDKSFFSILRTKLGWRGHL